MFKYIEDKGNEGEVAVESDKCESRMHENTQEGINAIPVDVYEVDDDRYTAHKNKPRARSGTDQPIYNNGWAWNLIYHMSTSGC